MAIARDPSNEYREWAGIEGSWPLRPDSNPGSGLRQRRLSAHRGHRHGRRRRRHLRDRPVMRRTVRVRICPRPPPRRLRTTPPPRLGLNQELRPHTAQQVRYPSDLPEPAVQIPDRQRRLPCHRTDVNTTRCSIARFELRRSPESVVRELPRNPERLRVKRTQLGLRFLSPVTSRMLPSIPWRSQGVIFSVTTKFRFLSPSSSITS